MTDTTKRIAQRRQLKRARTGYRRAVQSVAVVEAMHRAMHASGVMVVSRAAGLVLSSSSAATSSFGKCSFLPEEGCLAEPASTRPGALPSQRSACCLASFEQSHGAKA